MKEIIDGHICEMIINADGSFTFKFDGEETWHTRTGAKKSCTDFNIVPQVFKAYFKDIIETFNFNKIAKGVIHDIQPHA